MLNIRARVVQECTLAPHAASTATGSSPDDAEPDVVRIAARQVAKAVQAFQA